MDKGKALTSYEHARVVQLNASLTSGQLFSEQLLDPLFSAFRCFTFIPYFQHFTVKMQKHLAILTFSLSAKTTSHFLSLSVYFLSSVVIENFVTRSTEHFVSDLHAFGIVGSQHHGQSNFKI